jgi:hypothetical protein
MRLLPVVEPVPVPLPPVAVFCWALRVPVVPAVPVDAALDRDSPA